MKHLKFRNYSSHFGVSDVHESVGLQVYTLSMLDERLNAMYKSVTDGKFTDVLRQTNALLHMVALTVVDTRREVDELKDLLNIVK